jgi:hypothetical protein
MSIFTIALTYYKSISCGQFLMLNSRDAAGFFFLQTRILEWNAKFCLDGKDV